MIRNAIIRFLGGTPPKEKSCRRKGPLTAPLPPEDHWEVTLFITYLDSSTTGLTISIVVPKGADVTKAIVDYVVELSSLTPIGSCRVIDMVKTTRGS